MNCKRFQDQRRRGCFRIISNYLDLVAGFKIPTHQGGNTAWLSQNSAVKHDDAISQAMAFLLKRTSQTLKRFCKCVLIIEMFSLFEVPSYAQEFQAEGVVKFKLLDSNGNIMQQQAEAFEVDVKGCQWFISTAPYPPSTNAEITSWEIGSDGGNEIHQVTRFNPKSLKADSLNNSVGFVENGAVPDNIAGNDVSELWLAFASNCYFDGITNHMLKPIYSELDHSSREGNQVVKAEWKRYDSAPKLPQSVAYIENQVMGYHNGVLKQHPAPHPFENGYIRAQYESSSTTNIGNLILPMEFSIKEYAVVAISKAESKRIMSREVEGYLTNSQPICTRNLFVPTLTDNTYVDDSRFSGVPSPVLSLTYMVTSHIWPGSNSPVLQELYAQEVRNQEAFNTNHADTLKDEYTQRADGKRLIVLLFLIVSIFPLGYFAKNNWKTNGKT